MSPVRRGFRVLRDHGILPFAYQTLRYLDMWAPAWNTVTSRRPFGTNIFSRDWELLIVLDTCRVDAVNSIVNAMTEVDKTSHIRSVGSMSAEWMLNTFTEDYREEIAKTAFLSGNIWSHRIFEEQFHDHQRHDYDMLHKGWPNWNPIEGDTFLHYETVYPYANQDERLHPESEHIPNVLTDRAIDVGREKQCERLIVHYTLPHLNHIAGALDWKSERSKLECLMSGPEVLRGLKPEEKSYQPAREGTVSRETVYENYRQNLEFAMEYVNILCRNIDADTVVITADHGESFGENNIWGHPYGCPFSTIKTVPWVTTTANDEQTYEPKFDPLKRTPSEEELTDFLRDMGYYV